MTDEKLLARITENILLQNTTIMDLYKIIESLTNLPSNSVMPDHMIKTLLPSTTHRSGMQHAYELGYNMARSEISRAIEKELK
jgi:hypothetical protein